MRRSVFLFALVMGAAHSAAAVAAEAPLVWMLTGAGGALKRDSDRTHTYEAVALTRKLGSAYISASITHFGADVRQIDVTLTSSYTIGYVAGGATFGPWFVDGYASLGDQHYGQIIAGAGKRDVNGPTHSGVRGVGGDVGYIKWFRDTWSVAPSASLQWIDSRALRGQVSSAGPSEYETRETGATFGAGARIDHVFGAERGNSIGFRYTHYVSTNASAALSSAARSALDPARQSGHRADGWEDLGGYTTLRLTRRVYLDLSVSRTLGALAGDMTTTALGGRVLF